MEGYEQGKGKEHPSTLLSINSLAQLYVDQGRYGDAEPLYRRVLDAQERTFGREHPNTLTSVNNLANLYRARAIMARPSRFTGAPSRPESARSAGASQYAREHQRSGELYLNQGRYGDAEPLFRRGLDAQERTLGREHPNTLGSVNDLAILYLNQGRYGEAETLFRRVLDALSARSAVSIPIRS